MIPTFLSEIRFRADLADAWKRAVLPRRLGGVARRLAEDLEYETPWPILLAQTQTGHDRIEAPPNQIMTHQGKSILSYSQERLLFVEQFDPGASTYNIPIGIRLRGNLNFLALERSLKEIVQRHENLRTCFRLVEGGWQPEIQLNPTFSIRRVDLQGIHDRATREAEASAEVMEEVRRPFDLSSDLMFRATLFQVDGDEYLLGLTFHHIAADGWSIGVFLNELAVLYPAYLDGKKSPLPPLTVQYSDYAYWQRQRLTGDFLTKELEFWIMQLSEPEPSILEIPTDFPRPSVQTHAGDRFTFALLPEITNALKNLCKQENTTLFMATLAAFFVLLQRYSGQTDLTVGVPVSGRIRPEITQNIGFFVNNLVFRGDFSDNPTFRQFLAKLKQTVLEAFEHQEVPFERLVVELNPDRSLSHSPLFQTMFAFQNSPMPNLNLPGLTLTPLDNIHTQTAKFDLFLSLIELSNGLNGFMEYNSDLFETETIERMLSNYNTLLKSIINAPETPVKELNCQDNNQKNKILYEWNATDKDYTRELCVHQLFEEQAERSPDATAIRFGAESLTYQQLNQRANQLARYLQKLGLKPGSLVGISVERSIEMVVGLLGILKAGGAYVPLDPAYPMERLSYILADTQAKILLTQEILAESFNGVPAQLVCLDRDWSRISLEDPGQAEVNPSSDDLAYVIHTSGSTGKPKGVQIPHRALVNFLGSMQREPGLSEDDVLLAVTTLSFDIAGLELYLPLVVGAQVVIASREVASDGMLLSQELERSGATVMQATPTTWQMLLNAGWQGDPRLKILCGGEALPRALADELLSRCASLWNMYGPTETTIWSTIYQVEADSRQVPIGQPIANTQCYILDAQLQLVPIGVVGELYIGGDGLAKGYLNKPELTAERFVTNPLTKTYGARLYRTGDLVRYRSDGQIEYIGRVDYQVKVRGHRIELGEIESNLNRHPAIRQSVVVVREDTRGDKRITAYYIPASQLTPSVSELLRHLQATLPDFMLPSAFVSMEEFPLTPNGKVNRQALPIPDQSRPDLEKEYVAPRSEVETVLVNIMAELLNLEKVGIFDNFFELGGHSLLAIQLVSRLQKTLGSIALRKVFEAPTAAGLAEILLEDPERRARVKRTAELLLQIDQLSDEQVEKVLHAKSA